MREIHTSKISISVSNAIPKSEILLRSYILTRQNYVHSFLTIVILSVMLTDFYHPYLWSSDEPREAEIARETLVDNHWITPHLCGLPFLEKPPLYYNIVALAYRLTGSINPPAARAVSLAFGISMLVVVFLLGYSRAGPRCGWLSVLTLLVMPSFYSYYLITIEFVGTIFST